jgi:hypothetical protein
MCFYAQAHIFALTMMEWKPDARYFIQSYLLGAVSTQASLFHFPSISGSWHAAEFDGWSAMTAESSNLVPGFETQVSGVLPPILRSMLAIHPTQWLTLLVIRMAGLCSMAMVIR